MYDRYNRKINYLRISVTDRCNLRCTYCMPKEGITLKQHTDILSFEEIVRIVKTGTSLGINKIRLTGGEPLVRKGLPDLIKSIAQINEVEDIGLTTNGILLSKMAKELKQAGLKRVNISLDTLNPEKFQKITRKGKLDEVLNGIFSAEKEGLNPIKINFVRIKGINEEDELQVKAFCDKHGFILRFIRQMNLSEGEFYPVEGGSGGVCSVCNRLRLTADGYLIPCLFSDYGYSIKEMGIKEAFLKALNKKPINGKVSFNHQFYNVGG